MVPAEQAFPVGDQDAVSAAIIEPMSIAVRAVVRGRVAPGEKVVVFGAGPIGQAVAVAATDRGASVLLIDPVESRLERGQPTGADTLHVEPGADPVVAAQEWAGGDGPEVVFEATGVADVAQTAVELVASAGRVVIVGLGTTLAPLEVGRLAFKEVDLLGTSTCGADDFAEAIALVARRQEALAGFVTHEFSLEETPDAIVYAMRHPADVMKAVIRLDGVS